MAERRKTDRAAAAAGIKQFLEAFGIDLTTERMEGTPGKVAAAFSIFFSGLEEDGLSFWGDSIETKTPHVLFYLRASLIAFLRDRQHSLFAERRENSRFRSFCRGRTYFFATASAARAHDRTDL